MATGWDNYMGLLSEARGRILDSNTLSETLNNPFANSVMSSTESMRNFFTSPENQEFMQQFPESRDLLLNNPEFLG